MEPEAVDIAPFALPNTPANEVRFEEARDIVRVLVEYKEKAPASCGLSYLQKSWPGTRAEEHAQEMTPCSFGWTHQDDLFNPEWRDAAVKAMPEGENRISIVFEGLSKEFEEQKDYDVCFRRTLGIRIAAAPDVIRRISVFTVSKPASTALRVETGAGAETNTKAIEFEGYNAYIEGIDDLKSVSVKEQAVMLDTPGPGRFALHVRHLSPAHDYSGDDGLITFGLAGDKFTISLSSLEKQGPIWFEEQGIFIARAEDPTSFEAYRARNAGARTIAQRVLEHPEQSLAGAMHGQPRPHSVSYNLGCPRARQRFWVEANGDLLLHKRNVTWVEGKDTPRFKSGDVARIRFGLEKWLTTARFTDPEPAQVFNLHARRGGLIVEQKSFAVPLLTGIGTNQWRGDDTMVALVRLHFRNEGVDPISVRFPLAYSRNCGRVNNRLQSQESFLVPDCGLDEIELEGNRVFSRFAGASILRWITQTEMGLSVDERELVLSKELAPGASCDAILKVPYLALESGEEQNALDALDFDHCYPEASAYWDAIGKQGAQVSTPEPQLAALHKAHLAHDLVTDFEMPDGSGLINTSVGTSTYGNFTNESCMIVHELDQRGMHEEARKRLELWVKYQGTEKQPGNFTDYEGMYYGAGGFEQGAYNQHHGWALWALCEHYLMTRDDDWFGSVAESVIAGADWVFRQRRNTMTDLPHSRGWERGFLPAGSLEDVTDFYYWLSTNALTWRAVDTAAQAMEAYKHPEASRVRTEADAYRLDLIKGFETSRQYAPVVRLRDGRWVPHYPSRLYRRGREMGWIREVLEGSVYLLISGLYDPKGKAAQWILDDFQDNRYMSPPYGYLVPEFDLEWFDRGGISIQPNLLAGLLPYLDRDEPEIYLWMFYNAWAACYRPEINAMCEHPMPVLGYSNQAHFKTSDEANAVSWLRYTMIYAAADTIHFGRAVPRAWFAQNEAFGVENAVTRFGTVGVRFAPNPEKRIVNAMVHAGLTDAPGKMLLRFRLPENAELKKAHVNGQPRPIADAVRGDVDITGMTGEIEVRVEY